MNKTLAALIIKLSWQLKEINLVQEEIIQELTKLHKKLAVTQEKIQQACSIPVIINPEQEISRLNFIVRCQQEYENLSIEKKEFESRQAQLKERQLRLNTELKMLEKYQLKQKKNEQHNALSLEQKEHDELALQRRNNLENQ
jgi:hypothetical protein